MLLTIIVFVIILSILVLIHELGHFLVAKKLGIKVEEFGFGFPPRALSIKRGETLYSINWLPIGGFVKLYGEDEAGGGRISVGKNQKTQVSSDVKRAYYARPAWQRATVVIMGVIMNLILAIGIFYLFLYLSDYKVQLPVLGNPKFIGVQEVRIPKGVLIGEVVPNSPAEKAGIKPPSIVLSVNSTSVKDMHSFQEIINANKGKEITLVWQEGRNGDIHTAKVTPRISPPKNQGALGVTFGESQYTIVQLSYTTPSEKLFSGVSHSFNMILYTIDGLGGIIGQAFQEKSFAPIGKNVSGPLGIFVVVGTVLQIPDIKERILEALNLAGMISVALAFFNILPIPALDGGRLFFILIEMVSRKRINPKYEIFLNNIFMILLLSLILIVTVKDIPMFLRFISGKEFQP